MTYSGKVLLAGGLCITIIIGIVAAELSASRRQMREPTRERDIHLTVNAATDAKVISTRADDYSIANIGTCAYEYLDSQNKLVDSSGRVLDRETIGRIAYQYALVHGGNAVTFSRNQFHDLCLGAAVYAYDLVDGNDSPARTPGK